MTPFEEDSFLLHSSKLNNRVTELLSNIKWIIIDEIQKVPRLLDQVHKLIETTGFKFVLTGSSERKLKRGASNLLAGRAFVYHLYPFTYKELGNRFDFKGSLPKIYSFNTKITAIPFFFRGSNTIQLKNN